MDTNQSNIKPHKTKKQQHQEAKPIPKIKNKSTSMKNTENKYNKKKGEK